MVETTTEQKMKMCPLCKSDNGTYREIDVSLCQQFGIHYTKGNSWRLGPLDTHRHDIIKKSPTNPSKEELAKTDISQGIYQKN